MDQFLLLYLHPSTIMFFYMTFVFLFLPPPLYLFG